MSLSGTLIPFQKIPMLRPYRIALATLLFALAAPVASAKDHRPPVTMDGFIFLQEKNVMPLGTNPKAFITRGQFVKAVAKLVYPKDIADTCLQNLGAGLRLPYTHVFNDVSVLDSDAEYACVGFSNGFAKGDADGNFHRGIVVKTAEASAMIYKAFDVGPLGRVNVPGAPWYSHFVWDMDVAGYLPELAAHDPGHRLTWEEAGTMLLQGKDHAELLQKKQMISGAFTKGMSDEPAMMVNRVPPSAQTSAVPATTGMRPGTYMMRGMIVHMEAPLRLR